MRRKSSPADCPGQAKLIEPLADRSRRCGARAFAAPRHWQEFQIPAVGAELRACRVLPATCVPGATCCQLQKPAHELRRRHRLNLFAQRAHGKPVNARQQAPLAPFVLDVSCGARCARPRSATEISPQHGPAGFHAQQAPYQFRTPAAQQSRQSCAAVAGPRCDIQPVTSVSNASSREGDRVFDVGQALVPIARPGKRA